jgi:hypothetical protein
MLSRFYIRLLHPLAFAAEKARGVRQFRLPDNAIRFDPINSY